MATTASGYTVNGQIVGASYGDAERTAHKVVRETGARAVIRHGDRLISVYEPGHSGLPRLSEVGL